MRTFSLIILVSIAVLDFAKAQDIDSASYGNYEYRAVMGGGQKVIHDTTTPVSELIQRLKKPWELVETYKAYWIGYTDDMYSIADHRDEAIPLLVKFIDTSKNLRARIGGLYTLHLIGIDEKVAARFFENFVDKNARIALLRYLNDPYLNQTVVSLLMRDPWLSDIPQLLEYLKIPNRDYSKVLSALQRYKFDNVPIGQRIEDSLFNRTVNIPNDGDYNTYALIAFQKEFGPKFIVDKEVTESEIWKECLKNLTQNGSSTEKVSLDFMIRRSQVFSYCDFDVDMFYIYHNDTVEVLGPVKTRLVWLDWWGKLDPSQRTQFYSYRHISYREKYGSK